MYTTVRPLPPKHKKLKYCWQMPPDSHNRQSVLFHSHGGATYTGLKRTITRFIADDKFVYWRLCTAYSQYCIPSFWGLQWGGSPRVIGFIFGTEKLEWLGYNLVKVAWWSTQSFEHNHINVTDTNSYTDGHDIALANAALMHYVGRQKYVTYWFVAYWPQWRYRRVSRTCLPYYNISP